jgi:formyl-CoA transferase
VKGRLGIDYETLAKDNPRLVYASISGFGQTGPYATRPGFDQIAQGMGGLMSVTGLPGQGPVRVGIPIADLCGGIFAAYGVTVALLEREASGRGQWLHTSLLEAMIYMMDFQTSRWSIDHEIPGQAGNFHPTSIPTGVYRTKDGHINIAVFGGKIWERFCEAMGAPEWIADERSKTKAQRSVHRDWLNAEIEKRLQEQPSDYWIPKLNEAGVACGRINNIRETFEEPQVRHLGMLRKVTSKWLGEQELMGQPVTLTRTPSEIVRAAPRRGEHTEEILAEAGYGPGELARMKAAGVY